MKLVIAGSRDLHFTEHLIDTIYGCLFEPEEDLDRPEGELLEIVSGGCPTGADRAAKWWAEGMPTDEVVYKEFPADWDKHGKAAGPIRNRQMAEYGDALFLIWDGKSRGSANMKKEMNKLNKPVYELIIKYPGE